jgi:hypothetical protein
MITKTNNRTLLSMSGTTYDFDFRIDDTSELEVYGIDSDGVVTELTTGFTVAFSAADEEGTVTFDAEPTTYTQILMLRNRPYTQDVDIPIRGAFSEEDIERALDAIVILVQQIKEQTDRSIKIEDAAPAGVDIVLPTPVADKALAWDGITGTLKNVDLTPGDPAAFEFGLLVNSQALFNSLATYATPIEAALVPGTYSVSADMTIPAYVSLYIPKGAVIAVATTKTLTIAGSLTTGSYQIFDCTGSGKVAGLAVANPMWFGAVQDSGTTDCTAAFQLARQAASIVRIPDIGGGAYYKITENIINTATTGSYTFEGVGKPEIRIVRAPSATRSENSVFVADASLTDLTIRNLVLRGNQTGAGALGVGIYAAQISGQLIIDNVECSYFNEYGIYIWDTESEIGVIDVNNNYYQGFVVTNNAKLIHVLHIDAHDNGNAGVDIELSKGRGVGLANVHIDSIHAYDNGLYGVACTLSAYTWAECTTDDGLTIDDYGNIVFGTIVAHDNTSYGVYFVCPEVYAQNIKTYGNGVSGMVLANPYAHGRKSHIFGKVEAYGNTSNGVYVTGDSTLTYTVPFMSFEYLSCHDNGAYGFYLAGSGQEPDNLRIVDSYLNNNTTINSNLLTTYRDVQISGVGWPDGAATQKTVSRRAVLTTDGVTNKRIYIPNGARVKSVTINVANADSGTSPNFIIKKKVGGAGATTTLGTIDIKKPGTRYFFPQESFLIEAEIPYTSGGTVEILPGDVVVDGTSGATGIVAAVTLTGGTWAGGDAVGTIYLTKVTGTWGDTHAVNKNGADCATSGTVDVSVDVRAALLGWMVGATGASDDDQIWADPSGSWAAGGDAVCTMDVEYVY